MSVRGTPWRRVMVSTRAPEADSTGTGQVATPVRPAVSRKAPNSRKCLASCRKSSSPSMVSLRSLAMLARESRERSGARASRRREATLRKPRSALSTSAVPGFCTLITTSSPLPRSRAACTCATEADASGAGSMDANTWSAGLPRSASTTRLITSKGTAGVLSRHFSNSSTYSAGKSVGEEAMNCPSLMYVAPSRSKSFRSVRGARSGGRAAR
mmetsp:Transcript_20901/g.70173  ORF Transcript_20901/g.70173 Transcript_20901/m.70173 type:complete len:213 (-) Transcript_20901:271-909(-)